MRCPQCGAVFQPRGKTPGADGRAALWRVRVRLYDEHDPDEPEADSDPDLPAGEPGATVLRGLPAVAEHMAALASGYHGHAVKGLDHQTLMHRIKALRPTLSRRNGTATWRVPYETPAGPWLACVDVERVETRENGK